MKENMLKAASWIILSPEIYKMPNNAPFSWLRIMGRDLLDFSGPDSSACKASKGERRWDGLMGKDFQKIPKQKQTDKKNPKDKKKKKNNPTNRFPEAGDGMEAQF